MVCAWVLVCPVPLYGNSVSKCKNKQRVENNKYAYVFQFIHSFHSVQYLHSMDTLRWLCGCQHWMPGSVRWIHADSDTNEFSVVLHFPLSLFSAFAIGIRILNGPVRWTNIRADAFSVLFRIFCVALSISFSGCFRSLTRSLRAFLSCVSVRSSIVLGRLLFCDVWKATSSLLNEAATVCVRVRVECECLFIWVCFSMFICAPSRQNFNGHFSLLHRESRTINNKQL